MVRALAASLALASIFASSAAAQTKSAVTGAELQAILADAGMSATVIEDVQTGAPVASAQAGEVQFWVRALDCSGAPKACSTLMFFANFDMGRAPAAGDYQTVNGFNDRQVFGRAYLIPARNQVGVDYVIELDGGVSADHLARNIGRWTDVIGAFLAHFRAGAATS
jgi:hypothetical protein